MTTLEKMLFWVMTFLSGLLGCLLVAESQETIGTAFVIAALVVTIGTLHAEGWVIGR